MSGPRRHIFNNQFVVSRPNQEVDSVWLHGEDFMPPDGPDDPKLVEMMFYEGNEEIVLQHFYELITVELYLWPDLVFNERDRRWRRYSTMTIQNADLIHSHMNGPDCIHGIFLVESIVEVWYNSGPRMDENLPLQVLGIPFMGIRVAPSDPRDSVDWPRDGF